MTSTRRTFLRRSVGVTVAASACAVEGLETETVLPSDAGKSPVAHGRVTVETTVNAKATSLTVDPDETALEAVRQRLGLTGSKLGCGHGSCGACAMQVDGTPVATCILPATSLHGRKVTTIEGIGSATSLHPVQRAFLAEDALQCGYCTPGFVTESVAFYDSWRNTHGSKEPTRDEVAAALAGHLCRCGAYDGIYRAVIGACAGRFESATAPGPRHDGAAKVTGSAVYTVDVQPPGMLHAKALHAPVAHATITRLDWSAALQIPGVRGAVALLEEGKTIRWAGQEIVALAAVDEETAREAVRAVVFEYEEHTPAITLEEAMEGDALVWTARRDKKKPPNASEGPVLGAPWNGNVRGPFKLFSKAPAKANRGIESARGDRQLVNQRYETAVQCHTALEPHAAVADWSGETLRIWLSTQGVTHCSEDLAERFGLEHDQVDLVAEYIGAGFGAKGTLQTEAIIAAELSRATGKAVRYVLDRREEIMIGGHRPATRIDFSVATDEGGEPLGMRARVYSNSGVAVGHATTPLMRILYPSIPKDIQDFDVLTHGPPGKPFRGPGGPQAYFAMEQAVDELAENRGADALALRKAWDPNPARAPLYAWAEEHELWRGRRQGIDTGRFRRGVGLAFGAWFTFAEPKSRLDLEVAKGRVIARTASQDIGNGTRTLIANTISRMLGIEPHEVEVVVGHSRDVHGPMAGGSRTTSSMVPTCIDACEQVRDELLEIAERSGGRAVATDEGARIGTTTIPWRSLIERAPQIRVIGKRQRDPGGYFLPPIMGLAVEKYVSASIQLVEVEVDTRLGKTRATKAAAVFNIGKIVSEPLAKSQAMGGMIQGLSYALYEERRLDPAHGFLLSGNLEDYRIMGIGDVPELSVTFVEHGSYENVRGRSVGLGELVTLAPAAALANAVAHATGYRPTSIPVRVDRVLGGLS